MKRHPRAIRVTAAESDLKSEVYEWLQTWNDLTTAEAVSVLTRVFADEIGALMKHCIRKERHGDEDKPGDVE